MATGLPRRAEVLAALSVAIDLGLGQPAEHMLRSALIATRLADRLGLDRAQRDTVYHATLVMWIGFDVLPAVNDQDSRSSRR